MRLLPCLYGDDLNVINRHTLAPAPLPLTPPAVVPDAYLAPRIRHTTADCRPMEGPLKNFFCLANGISRGGRPSNDAAFEMLHDLGVRTILSLEDCTSSSARSIDKERACARRHGMEVIHAPVSPIFSVRFHHVMKVVHILNDPARRPIYVHCLFGHERTGFVIALNRFFNEKWPYSRALAEMMGCGFRPWLTPAIYRCFRKWCERNPGHGEPKEI